MYKLTLTHSDRQAIDFVGYRYFCGNDLFDALRANHPNNAEDWNEPGDITYELSESTAWLIARLVAEDTEELTTSHPLLSDELLAKLVELCDSIV